MQDVPSHDDVSDPSREDGSKKISIEPYRSIGNNKSIMDILLRDHTTGSNLLWATEDYASEGAGFGLKDEIQYLFIINQNEIIRPRYLKSQSEQRNRSRDMAEVFTPPWIVNKQNNLVDDQWFGKKGVFNTEQGESWIPTDTIDFGGLDWKNYVTSVRMEVCCGEAPYLTTRYDAINGSEIPVPFRVGLFDRKLRVISENIDSAQEWIDWAKSAVKCIYAYDFQGDNVLLARENILLALVESYKEKFKEDLTQNVAKEVSEILSWNIWQMDGMKLVVPFSCETLRDLDGKSTGLISCKACLTGKGRHSGKHCKIMDWEKDLVIEFSSLIGKEKVVRSNTANRTLDSFW